SRATRGICRIALCPKSFDEFETGRLVVQKLRLAVFFADKAEAVFNDWPGAGPMQYIHHMNMTACERPINPGGLQDIQLVDSIDHVPTTAVGHDLSGCGAHYHHRGNRALAEVVAKEPFAPYSVKGADHRVSRTGNPAADVVDGDRLVFSVIQVRQL